MFEGMYAGAEAGGAKPPWDYGAPRPQLVAWAEAQNLVAARRWSSGVATELTPSTLPRWDIAPPGSTSRRPRSLQRGASIPPAW
jgi:hypothetical protein